MCVRWSQSDFCQIFLSVCLTGGCKLTCSPPTQGAGEQYRLQGAQRARNSAQAAGRRLPARRLSARRLRGWGTGLAETGGAGGGTGAPVIVLSSLPGVVAFFWMVSSLALCVCGSASAAGVTCP